MKLKIFVILLISVLFNTQAFANNTNPQISVVMPIYNAEKFLEKSLSSIINQTFDDIEIICVNDGSTDNSAKILEKFAQNDDRIKIINQKNQYAGVARNNGLEVARGKYIIFLDSDDYFYPTMLEKLYNQAQKFDTDITMCKYNQVDYTTNRTSLSKGFNIEGIETEVFNTKGEVNPFHVAEFVPWNKLYKLDFIKNNNVIFSATKINNDIKFVLESCILADKMSTVDEVLIDYNYKNPSSVTSKRGGYALDIINVSEDIFHFFVNNDLFNKYQFYLSVFIATSYTYNLDFIITDDVLENFADKLAKSQHYPFIKDMLYNKLKILENNKKQKSNSYKNLKKVMNLIQSGVSK